MGRDAVKLGFSKGAPVGLVQCEPEPQQDRRVEQQDPRPGQRLRGRRAAHADRHGVPGRHGRDRGHQHGAEQEQQAPARKPAADGAPQHDRRQHERTETEQ
jgi:hypothetical protein